MAAKGFITSASGQPADFLEIVYPGARFTRIFGVNNHGDAVGTSDFGGFVRTTEGEFIDLGERVYPQDINDLGIVVGSFDVGNFQLAGFIATPGIREPRTWTATSIGLACVWFFMLRTRLTSVQRRQTNRGPNKSSICNA